MLKEIVDNMPKATEITATRAEQVFAQLQAAIIRGELAPGSKISEQDLADTYGISRGPLREALNRLEGQKLLVRMPHVGARVVSLGKRELEELYDVRAELEGMACRLAAARMGRAEVDALYAVLKTHEQDPQFQAGTSYFEQDGDYDFHYRIISASGNETLKKLLCDDLYQLVRMYRIRFSSVPKRPQTALSEHYRIVDALAAGDLIEVLPEHRLASPLSYWLLQGPRSGARPEVQAFCQWLLNQAEETRAHMQQRPDAA